jgi:hypothetical protein
MSEEELTEMVAAVVTGTVTGLVKPLADRLGELVRLQGLLSEQIAALSAVVMESIDQHRRIAALEAGELECWNEQPV